MNDFLGSLRAEITSAKPPLQFFIELFRNLPDGQMQAHGVLMPFKGNNTDSKFFNETRKIYRAVGDWLHYYFGDASLLEELTFTDKNLYKFHAERSKAWIEIIQETFLLSPELQQEYKNPGMLWMLLEVEFFEKMLSSSGFSGNATPTSKNAKYLSTIKACDFLQDPKNLLGQHEDTNSPTQWFCSLALELCAIPENHLFRDKWRRFLNTIKRCERNIQRSPLKVAFLKDDEIKFLQSGREKNEL